MSSFNFQILEINAFGESLIKDLTFKLNISGYIQENYNFINQEFFLGSENINEDYIKNILEEVSVKLQKFKVIKVALKNDQDLLPLEKKFLLQVLNNSGFELIRFKNSVYLEAEKAGLELNEQDRKKYVKRINSIQRVLHGSKISDNPSEVDEIFNKLSDLYNKNSDKLITEDKEIFSSFFKDFDKDLEGKEDKKNETKIKDNLILKKLIPIENVKKIFDLVIELYGLEGWKSEIGNYLNFSVSKNEKLIKIPKKKKDITIKKLVELIDHEIGVHAIRGYNTDITLKKNYSHYVEAEEGFAKISTSLLYDNLEDSNVDLTISFISTLIAENYDGEKTYELLKIYFTLRAKKGAKIEEIEQKARDRMLRIKKYFSLKEKGAVGKDVSYYRGEKQVQKYLLTEDDIKGFIKKFYFSKLSLEDLEIVDNFKELIEYEENQLIYPLWIGKILLNKLIGEKIILEDLKEKDLRFKAIENLSFGVKRKIVEILNLTK